MAKSPLFSTYRQGENRVTSSLLAVFERIDFALMEGILSAASGDSGAIQLVTFHNQPAKKVAQYMKTSRDSIPDARITASFNYLFELKTTRKAVSLDQLRSHLRKLDGDTSDERLFVITPDATQPKEIDELNDSRAIWFNFAELSQAIDKQLQDESNLVSEQSRFLLRELQSLLIEDGLIDISDVAVVAAKTAYPFYLKYSAYVCQLNRAFKDGVTHLGFYNEGKIRREIPKIIFRAPSLLFAPETITKLAESNDPDQRLLGSIVDRIIADEARPHGLEYQIFVLSSPNDRQTEKLACDIVSDARDKNGDPVAWTMGQRYTSLELLRKSTMTSQLT